MVGDYSSVIVFVYIISLSISGRNNRICFRAREFTLVISCFCTHLFYTVINPPIYGDQLESGAAKPTALKSCTALPVPVVRVWRTQYQCYIRRDATSNNFHSSLLIRHSYPSNKYDVNINLMNNIKIQCIPVKQ